MSAPLTPAQKRAITRRANRAKQIAYLAAAAEAREAPALYEPCGAETETKLLEMLGVLQALLARCRANTAAAGARCRREIARQSTVRA